MVFRGESADRRGCAIGTGAPRDRHRGERGGHRPDASVVAWGRAGSHRRCWVSKCGKAGEDRCWGARGGVAYRGQVWQSQIAGGGNDQGAAPEIGAGESPSGCEGEVSFPCPEKHLPPSKNAVSMAGEKHRPASPSLRPYQPLLGSASAPQPRQSMDERQIHAKITVPAENLPSAGLQIAYFARKSQPSLQSF